MVDRTRELENALGTGIKRVEVNEKETVILQRRSIRIKLDLSKGTILIPEHIEVLRPCPSDALPPYEIQNVLGKRLTNNLLKGDYIRWKDLVSA